MSRNPSSKLLAMLSTNGFTIPYVIAHIHGSGEWQTVLPPRLGSDWGPPRIHEIH